MEKIIKLTHIFQTENKEQLPLHHALGGLVKTVHQEHPNFHYQIINITQSEGAGAALPAIADIYQRECDENGISILKCAMKTADVLRKAIIKPAHSI